jgi:hypothetical protein
MHLFNTRKPPVPPWNKGKITRQRPPFELKHVWAIQNHVADQ